MSAPFWVFAALVITPTASGAVLIFLLDRHMPPRTVLVAYSMYLVGIIAAGAAGVLA